MLRRLYTADNGFTFMLLSEETIGSILVFKGTEGVNDWKQNLVGVFTDPEAASGNYCVKKGMAANKKCVWPGWSIRFNAGRESLLRTMELHAPEKGRVSITGHSMGAAYCVLAAQLLGAQGKMPQHPCFARDATVQQNLAQRCCLASFAC
jgi:Lipase (class 3)